MEYEDIDAGQDSNQRIAHACQLCREKRARCSGHRPMCQRCQLQGVECIYGYARGDRRRSLLAALEEHNARGDQTMPRPESSHLDRSALLKLTIGTGERLSIDDKDAAMDDIDDDTTESSIQSPIHLKHEDAISELSTTSRSARRKQHRRTRVSSACLECKKRRRKVSRELTIYRLGNRF